VSFAQVPFGSMSFVVRTSGTTPGLVPAIRAAISSTDKYQPIASIRPLTELLGASVGRQRFAMFFFGAFSGMALMLATIGLYGVMAYSVTQRTAELGLRMALGAQRSDVLRLILRQGGKLVTLGLIGGILAALLLTRSISAMLFGVSSYDPFTYAAISVLLTAVAAVACLIPARRAAKVDPLMALRYE
jgi:putative ABC transport system permease protein